MKDRRYEPMANGRPLRVPMEATPHGDRLQHAAEAVARRLPLDHPVTASRPGPEVRESEEAEGARSLGVPPGPGKRHEAGFLRVQRQAEPRQALRQHPPHPAGIFCTGEHHQDIGCVAQQHRPPPQPGAHGIKRMPVRFTPERLRAQA